jgi:phosphoribosylaminoimidazolecarboxamide formyltransferase/IMP cyclohydrolase
MIQIKRALLSVSDKTNILELALLLDSLDIEILSTGGTAKLLNQNKINVTEVSDYTKFPEMLDGRVKTLHPKIHGGILGCRDNPDHINTMKEHNISPIDLVIVNLYPFEETIAQSECTIDLAIENIDIGGPAMIRSAAKNYKNVAVLTSPNDYKEFSQQISKNKGSIDESYCFELAQKAFEHTSSYDALINQYLKSKVNKNIVLPNKLIKVMQKKLAMRYGENPHQIAAFYTDPVIPSGSLASFEQIQGKELSFNNLNDADNAWECAKSFLEPTCVIVKHANPCGISSASKISDAYLRAFSTDTTSAFGGIISVNRPIDLDTAKLIIKQFVEVIIAPEYTDEAKEIFSKKKNVRLLKVSMDKNNTELDFKKIGGGWLVQSADNHILNIHDCQIVTKLKPTASQLDDLQFAWQVAQYVKSNAIVFCKDKKTLGVGAGQMSRVDSTRIASIKAQHANISLHDSAVASDAFFPFRDGIDVLAEFGAKCVIQPGGSMRDNEVIEAADEHGLIMLFTGIRHFKH